MSHDSEKELAFNRSAEAHSKPSRRSHDAMTRLCKKMAEDVRERTHLRRTHRSYHNTRHLMQPILTGLTSEDRSSACQSPQELAEKAAVILALNITSGKKPN